jgi:hypothetical protein
MNERLPRVVLGVRKVTSPDEEFKIVVFGPSFVLLTSTKYYGLPPDLEGKKNHSMVLGKNV